MYKRLISWLLVLCLVFAWVPLSVGAEEPPIPEADAPAETMPLNSDGASATAEQVNAAVENEIQLIEPRYMTQVNPLYEGLITEDSLRKLSDIPAMRTTASDKYYTNVSEAGAYLCDCMEARQDVIVINYQTDTYSDEIASSLFHNFFESAQTHTGIPTEGDSIRWQWGGWNGSISGYRQNSIYYLTFTYALTYYTTADQEAELNTAVKNLLKSLNLSGKSDYEKVCAIYDYICANVTYDYANLNNDNYLLKFTPYAALINKTAVCQGYALLFYRLALESGMDARFIVGTGNGDPHSWNIVKLGSLYYNLDSTWDAGETRYSYFLKSQADFGDHIRSEEYSTTAFHSDYPMSDVNYFPDSEVEEGIGGTCGENLNWSFDETTGTLTISGTGPMDDYEENNAPWQEYLTSVTSVILESGITYIGDNAFCHYAQWNELEIPATVTGMGNHVFYGADHTRIRFLGNAPAVESDTFENVLGWIFYPYSAETYTQAFKDACGGRIIWSPYDTSGSYTAMGGCGEDLIWTLDANGTLSLIGSGDMANYGAADMQWFDYCSQIKEVIIPEGVTRLCAGAFYGMDNVSAMTIPSTVVSLGSHAFAEISGMEITFTGDAPVFDDGAFIAVDITAYYPTNAEGWDEALEKFYNNEFGVPNVTWVPYGEEEEEPDTPVTSGTCGENVTWSFDSTTGTLTISGTGPMDSYPILPWGDYVDQITSIVYEDGITSIECLAMPEHYYVESIKLPSTLESLPASAFMACSSLKELIIPDALKSIGMYAFCMCSSLTELTIPASVTFIDECGLGAIPNISQITFLGNAPEFGEYAFVDTTTTVYYPAGNETWTDDVMQQYGGTITWVPYGAVEEPALEGLNLVDGVWGYYKDNVLQIDYTGLVFYSDNWFYVENGVITWNYTGLTLYGNTWYYVQNSQLVWGYTGLVLYGNTWYYVQNSQLVWGYTGLVLYGNTWYYVQNSQLVWGYTGLVLYGDTWYYVQNSQLVWGVYDLVCYEGVWYYVENSIITWTFTDLVLYHDVWYYVRNSTIAWDYTGLVPYYGNLYYVENGTINWGYSGSCTYQDIIYNVVNGQIP